MIAVMHHDDVAVRAVRARDAREPLDQSLRRLRFPVPANFRPHHDALHSRAANFSAQQRIPVPVRRTHPARRLRVSGGGNRVLAARELVANSRARLKKQICMCVRMISEQVAARGNFLHEFRAGTRKFSDQKKCRAHGIAVKQFEKPRSDRRIRPIVKRERDFPRGGCVPQRRAEQFRRRSDRAPGGNSRSGRRATSTQSPAKDSIGLQAVIFARPRPRHTRRRVTLYGRDARLRVHGVNVSLNELERAASGPRIVEPRERENGIF